MRSTAAGLIPGAGRLLPMTYAPRILIVIGAAACGAAASLGWTAPPPSDIPPSPTVAVPEPAPAPPAVEPPARQVLVETILARPLFDPTRHPLMAAPAAAPSPQDSPALPRLTGVVVSLQSRMALFAATATDKPFAASPGTSVGAFTVLAVEKGRVTLVDAGGATRVLLPSFDPAQPTAVRTAPVPNVVPVIGNSRPRPPYPTLSAPPGEGVPGQAGRGAVSR